ncbi:hypothetical protein IMZ08_03920 [Bacillus luteolus]|uniref:SbsC C-terminal domain-containing protein n=1 Tax=Litchfieldia luteola TaxID=682179 RepID=A0ABR9QFE3_9BACI|nr:hypothetical protein [Cytobacillus luteolus]MBE4907205.1 hypothetical protein [Cytobacillus luteolus]MBP1943320.1 hypothetical protein [Cytobacillus luteolus]
MNAKKLLPSILSFFLLLSLVTPSIEVSAAVSPAYAESLVKIAETNGTKLKKQISYEYNKALTYPDMKLFNQTKDSYAKALKAVSSLKNGTTKTNLQSRLATNVKLHIDRAVAYIDALTGGKKIEALTKDLRHQVDNEILMLPRTSEYYHKLSFEIRKQAILLYRVYGKSTRDAILAKYKAPGEAVKNELAHFVTVYDLVQSANNELSYEEVDIYYIIDLLVAANDMLSTIKPDHVQMALQSDIVKIVQEFSAISEYEFEGPMFDTVFSEDFYQTSLVVNFDMMTHIEKVPYELESPFVYNQTQIISFEFIGYEYTVFIYPYDSTPGASPRFYILDISFIQ